MPSLGVQINLPGPGPQIADFVGISNAQADTPVTPVLRPSLLSALGVG